MNRGWRERLQRYSFFIVSVSIKYFLYALLDNVFFFFVQEVLARLRVEG